MKKVIIESHIPCVPDELSEHFEVVRLAPDQITPEAVSDADALIVRTRTRCDERLLGDSRVSFVATATIGTDHIDSSWCRDHGIKVASAPGCNAPAVAQYVMASILRTTGFRQQSPGSSAQRSILNPEGVTIGIVGVGHVGSIVADWANSLGMTTMLCDPPRADVEGPQGFCSLDEIAREADIITFHTPHTSDGPYPTHHIADRAFFESLRRKPMIINAARGPIVDTPALVDAVDRGLVDSCVIDCWEGEPNIDRRLLDRAIIATPHIAGYSLNGKIRATSMAINAMCEHFGDDYRFIPESVPSGVPKRVRAVDIIDSYDPFVDSDALKANPESFEALRNNYALRQEVPAP